MRISKILSQRHLSFQRPIMLVANHNYSANRLKFALMMGILIMSTTSHAAPVTIENNEKWILVNDSVMGGVSSSQVSFANNIGTFSGELSLERNGGFASTRTQVAQAIDIKARVISMTVKGDGRQYQLRERTDDNWDAIAYSQVFDTEKDAWQTFNFTADQFSAVYRGRKVKAPALALIDVKQIGFLLADKQPGRFSLSFKELQFRP